MTSPEQTTVVEAKDVRPLAVQCVPEEKNKLGPVSRA